MTAIERPSASEYSGQIELTVNGQSYRLELDLRTTLLDALREYLRLSGTKKGCDHGQCGACTVLISGRRINSCLTLSVMHEDDRIVTIAGVGAPSALHPLQAAFVERDGFQSGHYNSCPDCSAFSMGAQVGAGVPTQL